MGLFLTKFKVQSPRGIYLENKENLSRDDLKRAISLNYQYQYDLDKSDKLAEMFLEEEEEKGEEGGSNRSWKIVLEKDNIHQFFFVCFLNFLNQFTGINFLVLYSSNIYAKIGIEDPDPITFFMGFLNMFGGIFASFYTKKIGFKKILVYGMVGQAVSYLLFLFSYVYKLKLLAVLGSYGYIFTFAISLGASLYPYQTALLEPEGIGIASLAQWILTLVFAKFAFKIIEVFGYFFVFYTFMITALIGALIVNKYGVEILNKSRAQIKKEFLAKFIKWKVIYYCNYDTNDWTILFYFFNHS